MTANTRVEVARADVVGSLLRPAYLREARRESGETGLPGKANRVKSSRAKRAK